MTSSGRARHDVIRQNVSSSTSGIHAVWPVPRRGFLGFRQPAFTLTKMDNRKRLKGRNGTESSTTHSVLSNLCPQKNIHFLGQDAKWTRTDLLQQYKRTCTAHLTLLKSNLDVHSMARKFFLYIYFLFPLSTVQHTDYSHEEAEEHCACSVRWHRQTSLCSSRHTVQPVSFLTNIRTKWWWIISNNERTLQVPTLTVCA